MGWTTGLWKGGEVHGIPGQTTKGGQGRVQAERALQASGHLALLRSKGGMLWGFLG